MLNNTAFWASLAISVSLHVFAISAGGFFSEKPPVKKKSEIEVAYLKPEPPEDEIREKIMETLPQKYDLKKNRPRQKRPENKIAEDGRVKADGKPAKEQYLEENELEKLEEYMQYYELIREKIKKVVARNYTSSREKGSVEVAFTLDKRGALKNVFVDKANSASYEILRETALKSIKQCSPFPPPPEALGQKDIAFNLSIIFRKK